MNRRINVGLLGVGRMGSVYAETLARKIPEVRLLAVADIDDAKLRRVERDFSIDKLCKHPEELFEIPGLDAVVIATPTSTHAELTTAAANHGKSIFCEKPISISLHEATEVKKELSKNGTFFQMGFMRRFDPGYAEAWNKVDSGLIGRPILFKSTSRDPAPPPIEFADPEKSGGLILDTGIHDFDLARWFMGEVESVSSVGGALVSQELGQIGDIDNAVVSMEFYDGHLGAVDLSRNAVYGYDISTEILGTKGTLRVGYLRQTPVLTMTEDCISHDTIPHFPERFDEAFSLQMRNFVENVLHERETPVSIDDGIEALRIGIAATQALRSEGRVTLGSTLH